VISKVRRVWRLGGVGGGGVKAGESCLVDRERKNNCVILGLSKDLQSVALFHPSGKRVIVRIELSAS